MSRNGRKFLLFSVVAPVHGVIGVGYDVNDVIEVGFRRLGSGGSGGGVGFGVKPPERATAVGMDDAPIAVVAEIFEPLWCCC